MRNRKRPLLARSRWTYNPTTHLLQGSVWNGNGRLRGEFLPFCTIWHNSQMFNSASISQVLTGNRPFDKDDDSAVFSMLQTLGERPQRPSDGSADPIWKVLEKCWHENPFRRPEAAWVYDAFSILHSLPPGKFPWRLKLYVQSIKISLNRPKQGRVYVKFRYRLNNHTTSLTAGVLAGDLYTWFTFHHFYDR